jgi:hypothetical protein
MDSSPQPYPAEFAFLRTLPPADLRRWVITHSTLSANQREAQVNDHQPEPE